MNKISKNEITAVILAGGRSSRMDGEDKGLIIFRGRPMIDYVFEAVREKASKVFISANNNKIAYKVYGEVIEDNLDGFQGPLAGIATALSRCSTPYLLVLPCDSPFVSHEFIDKLIAGISQPSSQICVAHDGKVMHATFAVIKAEMESSLSDFLASGKRKMALWYRQQKLAIVNVDDNPEVLTNINRAKDLML